MEFPFFDLSFSIQENEGKCKKIFRCTSLFFMLALSVCSADSSPKGRAKPVLRKIKFQEKAGVYRLFLP
jgi:hypothetical protein